MSMERYRAYFKDFDISEHEVNDCIGAMTAIIENIVDDLFSKSSKSNENQKDNGMCD